MSRYMHNCMGLSSLKCEILPYVREALDIIYREVKRLCKLENGDNDPGWQEAVEIRVGW